MAAQPWTAALAASPLLRDSGAQDLPWQLKTHPDGAAILDRLAECPQVGLILSGRVAVYAAASDGRDVRISSLESGSCFGIANLFSPEPLKTVLRCDGETEIAYVPKEALIDLIAQSSAFALRYAAYCNEKLQFLLDRVALLTTQNHRARLIAWLLAHPEDEIRFPGKREELATQLGMSRAALFRELAQLDADGLLATKGTLLRILNRPAMEQLLHQPAPPLDRPML